MLCSPHKADYRPRVVVTEFNRNFNLDCFLTFPDDPNEGWKGDQVSFRVWSWG